ncbi:MAG: hypothetical protein N3F11_02920 [Casimicrobiaceae bacterium]|nr:hypothetical protein [Casimicrobiaceae bacterium]
MACSAALAAVANAQPLSLGEQFALRAYTGQAMGQALANVVRAERLGILTNTTSICSSLTSAIGSQFVASRGQPDALRVAAVAKSDEVKSALSSLSNRDAVALIFGGQATAEENYALTKAALAELAASKYPGAVFFHLRVWAPRFVQRAASEDPAIAAYLASKENLFTATVDANAGKVLLHQAALREGEQRSARVLAEVPMNETWLTLFKRSM